MKQLFAVIWVLLNFSCSNEDEVNTRTQSGDESTNSSADEETAEFYADGVKSPTPAPIPLKPAPSPTPTKKKVTWCYLYAVRQFPVLVPEIPFISWKNEVTYIRTYSGQTPVLECIDKGIGKETAESKKIQAPYCLCEDGIKYFGGGKVEVPKK